MPMNWVKRNKYKLMVLIPGLYLLVDGLVHKGMVRVMLPVSFPLYQETSIRPAVKNKLEFDGKEWIKAVNTTSGIKELDVKVPGFECDVYYVRSGNYFDVHHDKNTSQGIRLDSLLDIYQFRRMRSCIWLDLKNLRIRITLRKGENVFEVRATPRVDRLRVIADHHQVTVFDRERVNKVRLDLVRVLILVHENELELAPVKFRDLVVLF